MRTTPTRSTRSTLSTLAAPVAAVVVAVAAAGLAVGPAHADGLQRSDPNDTSHGSDLLDVKVANRDANLVIVTTHDNLRRDPSSGSGGLIYLDTDPTDRGPEYVVAGGWFEGTDYTLVETEGFGVAQWGEPVNGSYEVSIDYAAGTVRTRISQAALGTPEKVRVAVKASGPGAASTDWLGQPRSFTPWIDRG